MKHPAFPTILAVSLLATVPFSGCKPQPTPEQREQEIEARVAQRLAEERVRWQQSALDQKTRDLAMREQKMRQREQQATVPGSDSTADTQPLLADYQIGNDQVGGGPCSSYNAFYKYLGPYGTWFDLPYYGLVWQPSVAVADPRWRPYTNGQWAYSADTGWTWISGEPFGWAAYHYGRWTCLAGVGWLWAPGTQWAPAWVAWRQSNDYVGWAPLPPEIRIDAGISIGPGVDAQGSIAANWYSFVPFISFGEQNLSRELVSPDESGAIMDQTANITHIAINKAVVVNQGPSLQELQRRSRSPINILKIVRRNNIPPQQVHIAASGVLEIPDGFIAANSDSVEPPAAVRAVPRVAAIPLQQSNSPSWVVSTPWPADHGHVGTTVQPRPSAFAARREPHIQPEPVRRPTSSPWTTPATSSLQPTYRIQAAQARQTPEPPRDRQGEPLRAQEPPRAQEPARAQELPRAQQPPHQHEAQPTRTPEPAREPAHEETSDRSKAKEKPTPSPR